MVKGGIKIESGNKGEKERKCCCWRGKMKGQNGGEEKNL